MTDDVVLTGLEGETPLGFLAGLGVLRVLKQRAARSHSAIPALRWQYLDRWRPVLSTVNSLDEVARAVLDDIEHWRDSAVFAFKYPKVETNGVKLFSALKPPIAVLRAWLKERLDKLDHDSLEYAAVLMSEPASRDIRKGAPSEGDCQKLAVAFDLDAPLDQEALPTAFDFTTRNTQFLDQMRLIRDSLTQELILEGLGQGRGTVNVSRTMAWHNAADTPGAIYTGYKAGAYPAAEWLAFQGLVFLPVFGVGEFIRTTACTGRRKDGLFTWPLWSVSAEPYVVRSLLGRPDLEKLNSSERRLFGIDAVFRAALTKGADGRSGVFSPSTPV